MVRLNLTGHNNRSLNNLGFINCSNIPLKKQNSFEENITEVARFLQSYGVNSDEPCVVALPSPADMNAMVITSIAAITGRLPIIVHFEINKGRYLVKSYENLQNLKTKLRKLRYEEKVNNIDPPKVG